MKRYKFTFTDGSTNTITHDNRLMAEMKVIQEQQDKGLSMEVISIEDLTGFMGQNNEILLDSERRWREERESGYTSSYHLFGKR